MLQIRLKVQIKVPFLTHLDMITNFIIDKGMGKGDHQTPQEFGTKYDTNGVIAISHVEHVTPLTQQLQQKPLT
jgi:hypothetical protein